jgi:hypothetical protein
VRCRRAKPLTKIFKQRPFRNGYLYQSSTVEARQADIGTEKDPTDRLFGHMAEGFVPSRADVAKRADRSDQEKISRILPDPVAFTQLSGAMQAGRSPPSVFAASRVHRSSRTFAIVGPSRTIRGEQGRRGEVGEQNRQEEDET